jgi:hypothetical protein
MKKTLLMALIACFAAGSVSAQQEWGLNSGIPTQTVTGTLQLRDGTIAVVNDSQVHYVPSLERFIGFIDGLKEGAQVSLEGYIYSNPLYTHLTPSKLTMNGKTYDLLPSNLAQAPRGGRMNYYYTGHNGWGCHGR